MRQWFGKTIEVLKETGGSRSLGAEFAHRIYNRIVVVMLTDTLIELKKKPIVVFTRKRFILPPGLQQAVDDYWKSQLEAGKRYTRGEVFTISDIEEHGDRLIVSVGLSDYAHYIYTRRKGLPEEFACKNIHTSCLIVSSDDTLIFGRMAGHTSDPGNIQCVGGGLDFDDIREDVIDLDHSIGKELWEEVGIALADKGAVSRIDARFLRYDSAVHSIAMIFVLRMQMTAAEFSAHYARFEADLRERGEVPEFESLLYLPRDMESVEAFLASDPGKLDHYMKPLLERSVVL